MDVKSNIWLLHAVTLSRRPPNPVSIIAISTFFILKYQIDRVVIISKKDGDILSIWLLYVDKNFSIYKYILNKKNFGFTKAANQAIKLCDTEYILNINADCFIKEEDIMKLINSHQNYK